MKNILIILDIILSFWKKIPDNIKDNIITVIVESFDYLLRRYYKRAKENEKENEENEENEKDKEEEAND